MWDATTTACCRWDMAYELGGQTFDESLFVLAREGDRWQAACRVVLPATSQAQ